MTGNSVWIVETISENEGGYVPDSRWIQGVFSSKQLAEEFVKKHASDMYDDYEISEYEVDSDE